MQKIIHSKLSAAVAGLAICFATIQFYFVRELLVAEFLFVSVFLCLFLVGGTIYLLGAITEQSLHAIEVKAHNLADARVRQQTRTGAS